MRPILFDFQGITIYTYAFLIAFGSLFAGLFTKWRAKKELGIKNIPNSFFYGIFIAGFIGGKLFFYLQTPLVFIKEPSLMLQNFNGGYVFYGSFLVIIPYIIWYLKKHKMPVLPMLDVFAITTTIVHSIGRLGCFAGGCCYGAATDSSAGLIFPATHGVAVHPTQLYESLMLLIIMVLLTYIRRHKQFNGQIFLIYLMLYAFGRGILEFFRGDDRGYIITEVLSHSQFIALSLISVAVLFYYKLYSSYKLKSI